MLVDGVPAKHPRRTLTLVNPYPHQMRKVYLMRIPLDCQDVTESREQAFIFERTVYDVAQSLCGDE
jgi:hypothetical protein